MLVQTSEVDPPRLYVKGRLTRDFQLQVFFVNQFLSITFRDIQGSGRKLLYGKNLKLVSCLRLPLKNKITHFGSGKNDGSKVALSSSGGRGRALAESKESDHTVSGLCSV
jgi:hypothetical protein